MRNFACHRTTGHPARDGSAGEQAPQRQGPAVRELGGLGEVELGACHGVGEGVV